MPKRNATVAVIGAGDYIGAEIAKKFAAEGFTVFAGRRNGANLLVLAAAAPGSPPIVGTADPADMTDPLPQAMILTAIVITLGMTAFLLALAYRSWRLSGHDEVQDDAEDRRVRELAERDEGSDTEDLDAAEGVRG